APTARSSSSTTASSRSRGKWRPAAKLPGPMASRRFHVVAFDLYATLLDVSGLAARLTTLLGSDAAGLLASWRKQQLERTWELQRSGGYQPFDEVTAAALTELAPELDDYVRAQLCEAWLDIPPFADAARALNGLAAVGVKTAILSNGTVKMIESAVVAAKLIV